MRSFARIDHGNVHPQLLRAARFVHKWQHEAAIVFMRGLFVPGNDAGMRHDELPPFNRG
jgi:hypothetical protein